MFYLCRLLAKTLLILVSTLLLVACSEPELDTKATQQPVEQSESPVLAVYKDPNCGCCQKWIKHINEQGLQSKVYDSQSMGQFKQDKGIAPQYRSCHTGVSNEGYVFEGHVPAKFILKFLEEKPRDAIGLSVPAMPIGTPGMEMGDKFMPYHVLLLKADGSNEIYAKIDNYQAQF